VQSKVNFSAILVDSLVLLIAGYSAWLLVSQPNGIKIIKNSLGFKLLLAGLSAFTIFYLADMLVNVVFPVFFNQAPKSGPALYAHLLVSWLGNVIGVMWMAIGFLLTVKAVMTLVGELESSKKVLSKELDEQRTEALRLRDVTQRALAASRAKSEQLANVSHELRTPLNSIIGFAELLQKQTFGPLGHEKYREYSTDIRVAGRHLLGLINDILDLSKIESGHMELQEETLDLEAVIAEANDLIREKANELGIAVEQYIPAGMPWLHADERRVKQIILNLLSNGVKFTPYGGRVTIKAWCSPAGGHVVQIMDTGIGMEPENIPKALAPFGQLPSELGKGHHGTGLGLPLSKSLMEMHGGSLNIESQPGQGTTVTLRFPTHRIVDLPHRRPEQAKPAHALSLDKAS